MQIRFTKDKIKIINRGILKEILEYKKFQDLLEIESLEFKTKLKSLFSYPTFLFNELDELSSDELKESAMELMKINESGLRNRESKFEKTKIKNKENEKILQEEKLNIIKKLKNPGDIFFMIKKKLVLAPKERIKRVAYWFSSDNYKNINQIYVSGKIGIFNVSLYAYISSYFSNLVGLPLASVILAIGASWGVFKGTLQSLIVTKIKDTLTQKEILNTISEISDLYDTIIELDGKFNFYSRVISAAIIWVFNVVLIHLFPKIKIGTGIVPNPPNPDDVKYNLFHKVNGKYKNKKFVFQQVICRLAEYANNMYYSTEVEQNLKEDIEKAKKNRKQQLEPEAKNKSLKDIVEKMNKIGKGIMSNSIPIFLFKQSSLTTLYHGMFYDKILNSFVIVIKGTESLIEWLINFRVWPKKLEYTALRKDGIHIIKEAFVHSQMGEVAGNLAKFYLTILKNYKHKGYIPKRTDFKDIYYINPMINDNTLPSFDQIGSIIITGHSLGAGVGSLIALILHDDVLKEFGKQVLFIGFATPSVLDKDTINETKHYMKSFIYRNDIVPRLNATNIFKLDGPFEIIQKALVLLKDITKEQTTKAYETIKDKLLKKLKKMQGEDDKFRKSTEDKKKLIELFPSGELIYMIQDTSGKSIEVKMYELNLEDTEVKTFKIQRKGFYVYFDHLMGSYLSTIKLLTVNDILEQLNQNKLFDLKKITKKEEKAIIGISCPIIYDLENLDDPIKLNVFEIFNDIKVDFQPKTNKVEKILYLKLQEEKFAAQIEISQFYIEEIAREYFLEQSITKERKNVSINWLLSVTKESKLKLIKETFGEIDIVINESDISKEKKRKRPLIEIEEIKEEKKKKKKKKRNKNLYGK